jgi:hypothetical protein
VKPLYQGLDFEGHKFVTAEDFEILQNWKPPAFLSAADNPSAAEEFKKCLIEEYGNYLKAWRHCLAPDAHNRCIWTEFEDACRKLHFDGDYAGAWRVLDKDLSGYITLGELDAEANETLLSFRLWAHEEFGNVASAFNAFVLWTKFDNLRQDKLRQEKSERLWDQRHQSGPKSASASGELSPKMPQVTFSESESEAESEGGLKKFKRWAGEEYGASAFHKPDEESEITYRHFKNACKDFGLQLDTLSLFSALDMENSNTLSLKKVTFLDHWECRLRQESFEDLGDLGLGIHHSYIPQELIEYDTSSPGPGSYNIRSPIQNFRDPSVKFHGAFTMAGGSQARLPYPEKDSGLMPSPFDYSLRPGFSDKGFAIGKTTWSFTREERAVVQPQGPPSKTPGPGNYYLPENTGPHIPVVTCSPRRVLRIHPLFRAR